MWLVTALLYTLELPNEWWHNIKYAAFELEPFSTHALNEVNQSSLNVHIRLDVFLLLVKFLMKTSTFNG